MDSFKRSSSDNLAVALARLGERALASTLGVGAVTGGFTTASIFAGAGRLEVAAVGAVETGETTVELVCGVEVGAEAAAAAEVLVGAVTAFSATKTNGAAAVDLLATGVAGAFLVVASCT